MPKLKKDHPYFRGVPVVDAKKSLLVTVTKSDIKRANRKDPQNCMFAIACKRQFGSRVVGILRNTAYVEVPDARGRRKINRYILSHETQNKIIRLDSKGKASSGGGFIFNAPPKSQRMDIKRKYTAKYKRDVKLGKRTPSPTGRSLKTIKLKNKVRDGRGLGITYAA